ncbi:helix-hairpin-helix domain-containing protein [Flavobacterium silvaticum]|uniref:Helix-hairpin-helix domain-containing protein n=1 Tax=Flavobacterium silvaticum TaxID=1852020 RepID=A0A972JGC1_9FLAO|nr:helix-hairpin-helix domain-containing protein [Flavobacterium silvaticum]NMH26700.1 helix-hairpin-helix domain-containing protein [Flavobacterium silvaticum]
MKNPLSLYFRFDRLQRYGIIILLSLVFILQVVYFTILCSDESSSSGFSRWPEMEKALANLPKEKPAKPKNYPFNPNFITDYKGYRLGLTTDAIDRLKAFREKGLFVNSDLEFKQVTGIPDSTLKRISPFFKFPDWVKNKNRKTDWKFPDKKVIEKQDLNTADSEELEKVYGIGEVLAKRILETKEKLGSFADSQQLLLVYGLRPEVVEKVEERFYVKANTNFKKLKINDAGLKEIAAFPYFNYTSAKKIISARTMSGKIQNTDDLSKIVDLNGYNLKTIALYLEF